jgi:hypothetical protein
VWLRSNAAAALAELAGALVLKAGSSGSLLDFLLLRCFHRCFRHWQVRLQLAFGAHWRHLGPPQADRPLTAVPPLLGPFAPVTGSVSDAS